MNDNQFKAITSMLLLIAILLGLTLIKLHMMGG